MRREELAELTGISVDYVVRLEQGRSTTPSDEVVAALARALQLTNAERDHLYRLAGLVPATDGAISDHILPGIHRVLNRLGDAVFAADWQVIWWNRGCAALVGDPSSSPPALRNFTRDSFPINGDSPTSVEMARDLVCWRYVEAAIVSDLRRATGRFPNDRRLTNLIEVLTTDNQPGGCQGRLDRAFGAELLPEGVISAVSVPRAETKNGIAPWSKAVAERTS